MNNVIRVLDELRMLYDKQGDIYRVRAYDNAIEKIKNGQVDQLTKHMQEKIKEIIKYGTTNELNDLRGKNKLFNELIDVPGFGPKVTAKFLDRYLNENKNKKNGNGNGNVNENKIAGGIPMIIKNKKIMDSLSTQQQIGLKYYTDMKHKIHRSEVLKIFEIIRGKKCSKFSLELAGSYRRGKENMKDIDILFVGSNSKDFDKFIDICLFDNENIEICDVISDGSTFFSAMIKTKLSNWARHIDILFTDKKNYHAALIHMTGSRDFNIMMRGMAKKKGCKFSQNGLICNGKKIKSKSEWDILSYIGIDNKYIDPKKR